MVFSPQQSTDHSLPRLDEPCSKHFRYRDLIECGETWHRYQIDNWPQRAETYAAIRDLSARVLDPVVEQFGPIELTYAFVSPALDRLVRLKPYPRTTRRLDQHAGCELNRYGKPYCARLGLAADFGVPGVSSLTVAQWVIANTGFDRLYFYGEHRPFHVSVGPENSRVVWPAPSSRARTTLIRV